MSITARTLLVALVTAVACGDDGTYEDADARDARALLADVQRADYASWPGEVVDGDAPHGTWSAIFVDPIMQAAIADDGLEHWPEGATIVCEGRGAQDDAAELLMIMRKQDAAWIWAQLDADGEPRVYGRAVGCVHCHEAGADFVRSIRLP